MANATKETTRTRRPVEVRLKERANKSVTSVLKGLQAVAGLAKLNPTQEQKQRILAAITGAVSQVETAFAAPASKEASDSFDL